MPNDLTWQQLQTEIGVADAIKFVNGDIIIDVGKLTSETYLGISSVGVTEFIQKLLDCCNKAQVLLNQNLPAGQRLATFPLASLASPTVDIDGKLRTTCSQQVVSRIAVDIQDVVGNQV